MQAIVARPGTRIPALFDIDGPGAPRAGEVLCRTLELGVCGTDREILESLQPVVPTGCDFLVLGHECLGQVAQVGPGVTQFRPGDLVVPVVRRAFPEFADQWRVDMLAFGEFVERGIYLAHGFATAEWLDRPEYLLRVDPRIASVAVLAEPLAVSEKAVNEALAVQRGRLGAAVWGAAPPRVLVTGQGPIGFTALTAAVCRGWPVTMAGRDSSDTFRSRLAVEFDAEYRSLVELGEEPTDIERDGYDLVLECTGSDEVMLHAARWLRARGVMVWLGSTRRPTTEPRNVQRLMRDGILRNHIHLATVNSAPRDFVDALAHLDWLLHRYPQPLHKLITHRVELREALPHYTERIPQGIKTVVRFESPG